MTVKHIFPVLAAILTLACSKEPVKEEVVSTDLPLVVEGWIESGNPPIVIVSSAVEASEEWNDVREISENVLRYAKVSVEHNGVSYPLSARLSDEYMLQNYFTTGDLTGETGGEYRLTVEWQDKRATAVTTIPEPCPIEKLEPFQADPEVDKFTLKATILNDMEGERFYKFFTWVENKDAGYNPSFMGTFSNINRGPVIDYTIQDNINYIEGGKDIFFHKGDIISVKLATTDETMYDFWRAFEENSLCAVLPFSSFIPNLKGNINGAKGYWAGYGISTERICIEK